MFLDGTIDSSTTGSSELQVEESRPGAACRTGQTVTLFFLATTAFRLLRPVFDVSHGALIAANKLAVKRAFNFAGTIVSCCVYHRALVLAHFVAGQWADNCARTVTSLESCRGTGDCNDKTDSCNGGQT